MGFGSYQIGPKGHAGAKGRGLNPVQRLKVNSGSKRGSGSKEERLKGWGIGQKETTAKHSSG